MCCVHTGQDLPQATPGRVKGGSYVNSFPKKFGFPARRNSRHKKKIARAWRVILSPKIFVELYLNLNVSCVVLLQHLMHLVRC